MKPHIRQPSITVDNRTKYSIIAGKHTSGLTYHVDLPPQ